MLHRQVHPSLFDEEGSIERVIPNKACEKKQFFDIIIVATHKCGLVEEPWR